MLTPLNLPKAKLKLRRDGDNNIYVFDVFRKKELLLTPEEWVRQHFFHFLLNSKNVPLGLLSSEHPLNINGLQRRCDGVVFDKKGQPLMIIECKAPTVQLSEKTLHQIAQYNFKLNVDWLILTNGLQTITCFINRNERKLEYLEDVPDYIALTKRKFST